MNSHWSFDDTRRPQPGSVNFVHEQHFVLKPSGGYAPRRSLKLDKFYGGSVSNAQVFADKAAKAFKFANDTAVLPPACSLHDWTNPLFAVFQRLEHTAARTRTAYDGNRDSDWPAVDIFRSLPTRSLSLRLESDDEHLQVVTFLNTSCFKRRLS